MGKQIQTARILQVQLLKISQTILNITTFFVLDCIGPGAVETVFKKIYNKYAFKEIQ